jgi:streptomycin 6-kinase
MSVHPPALDDELRTRLRRRYGTAVDAWLDMLPATLEALGGRWGLDWGTLIQRGSVSVVIRCRMQDGRAAVLKLSPDRARIASEAAALAQWTTPHVPAVLAVDEILGALMIEAIDPGTPLADVAEDAGVDAIGALLTSLRRDVGAARAYPPLADRVARLFDAGAKVYGWRPELVELVPPEVYDRSRELALRLAAESTRSVLLHGDATPANVLDGGDRGLVAVDPAPCLGDPAFDAIDLLLWRAETEESVVARAVELAPAIGARSDRLLDWCVAFAGMNALEIAERTGTFDERVGALLAMTIRA